MPATKSRSYFTAFTWRMESHSVDQQFLLTGTVCSRISPYKLSINIDVGYKTHATVNTFPKNTHHMNYIFFISVASRAIAGVFKILRS